MSRIHIKVWIDGRIMFDTVNSKHLNLLDRAGIRYEIQDENTIIY